MIRQYFTTLPAFKRGFHLIDDLVLKAIPQMPETGILHIFIQHTSAGLSINENADPAVLHDYETIFNKLVPEGDPDYRHNDEGEDDMPAHVKSSLVGSSVTIPITGGKLNFGTWQGIYLCEFRNRASGRKLVITIYG